MLYEYAMTYQYKCKIGLLTISPHSSLPKLHQLWLGSYLLGTYNSAAAAAAAVDNSKTSCAALDKLPREERPEGLAAWEKVATPEPAMSSSPTRGKLK